MTAPAIQRFRIYYLLLLAVLVTGYVAFRTGINYSADWIWNRPEYGHGLIIPFVSAYLIWQRRAQIAEAPRLGAWVGPAVVAIAALVNAIGQIASLFILQQYAAVVAFFGITIAVVGIKAFRAIAVPMLLLLFMIPLPEFIYQNLSARLQIVSSILGVWVVRLFGISVYLEGNVIDLGVYQLQVAEACDGLRYLFPLMTLGFIVAYFFRTAMWKRVLVFISSVPITILMNSFRIGMIGVMVEYWGIGMAEGFLHEFQGWAVFMVSLGLLLLEVLVLAKIGADGKPWREVFGIYSGPATSVSTSRFVPAHHAPLLSAAVLLAGSAAYATLASPRIDVVPPRADFSSFPLSVEQWEGRRQALDRIYTDQLQLDDYLLADFLRPGSPPINFYVAWYDAQQPGRSTHSPRSCLPSGGWRILEFDQIQIPEASVGGRPLRVNRVLIQLGTERQLVYYWFQQRGRVVTNEYAAKWFLFWDSVTRNRTDGALVRLVAPLSLASSPEAAERELSAFTKLAAGQLTKFVPD